MDESPARRVALDRLGEVFVAFHQLFSLLKFSLNPQVTTKTCGVAPPQDILWHNKVKYNKKKHYKSQFGVKSSKIS